MKTASFILCGVFAASVAATPLVAQVPMPDARQMSGIPRPVADLPDGTISVRLVRGQLSNNILSHPVEIHGADKVRVAKTDENGRAQFSGLPPGTIVHAVAVVDGERLESRPFAVPGIGGIRVMLVATPGRQAAKEAPAGSGSSAPPAVPGVVVFGGESRFVIELVEDAAQVFYLLDIVNKAPSPVDVPAPLVLEMPPGAQGTTVVEGSSPQATAQGPRVTIRGPFQPGRTAVQVAYQLPHADGTLALAQTLPAALEQLSVVAEHVGDLRLASPQVTSQREAALDGRTYLMASGPGLPAGGRVAIALSGLPRHSAVPRTVAVALAIAIALVGVWGALGETSGGAAVRRRYLQSRRETIFGHLVKIEEQRRSGALDPGKHATRRTDLIAQLERVYGELGPDRRGGDEGLAR